MLFPSPDSLRALLRKGLLIGVFAALPVAAQNLLQNPGFESGTTGWFGFGPVAFAAVGTPVQSGALAARIQNRTATWNGVAQSLLGRLQAGTVYRASAWVRVSGSTNQPVKLTLRQGDGNGTTYVGIASTTVAPAVWTQLSGGFTHNFAGTVSELTLYVEGPAAGVELHADDLVMEPYDWKTDANARIEQVRKRDARLRIVTPSGEPVPGVTVSVRQTRPRFAFGSAINANVLTNPKYAAFFRTNFAWAVMENESKWYANEPSQGNVTYTKADGIAGFCRSNLVTLRGHCLFWAVDEHVQSWVTNLSNPNLLRAVSNRLDSAVTHFRDKFVHWDVNNEMLHGNFYGDRLGDGINPWMFQRARALDSDVQLFVNDYNVVAGGETEAYKTQIRTLLASNAPVGGIGAQCHFGSNTSPSQISARLDSLAELGLPIWATEYDYLSTDETNRADFLEMFYRIAFSKTAVDGILMWGFWAGSHWRGSNAAIVNLDWTLNEAGRRYQSLLAEWSTHTAGLSAADGSLGFRGFHADYDVMLTRPGGQPTLRRFTLAPGSGTQDMTLILPPNGQEPLLHTFRRVNPGPQFTFQLTGPAGKTYSVEVSTNLAQWSGLLNVTNATGTVSFADPATASPRRFYRARQTP